MISKTIGENGVHYFQTNPGEYFGGLSPQSRDQLTTWMTFGLSGAKWSLTLLDTLQISQVFSSQDISRCFLGKNICNSNPNRNPCFLTEKTELSSETGKVLHHQGRQCEASEGLKFRDLTIHGVVSWQRWRLEASAVPEAINSDVLRPRSSPKPENFGDMTWVEFRTPKSIRCHDSAQNGAGLYMLTINLPYFWGTNPQPPRPRIADAFHEAIGSPQQRSHRGICSAPHQ